MQVDNRPQAKTTPWKAYEKAYTENAVLLPFVPRQFYRVRWALMNRNPLCWRVPGGRFTWGELLITLLIVGQLLWFILNWSIDPGMRTDVKTTGARIADVCNCTGTYCACQRACLSTLACVRVFDMCSGCNHVLTFMCTQLSFEVFAGHVASVCLMIVYIIAIHNNSIILLLSGLPFDRALPWHKMLAFSAIINGLLHASAFYVGGRADTMTYARQASHHVFTGVTKAYGMEVTGVSTLHGCAARHT